MLNILSSIKYQVLCVRPTFSTCFGTSSARLQTYFCLRRLTRKIMRSWKQKEGLYIYNILYNYTYISQYIIHACRLHVVLGQESSSSTGTTPIATSKSILLLSILQCSLYSSSPPPFSLASAYPYSSSSSSSL